MRAPVNTPTWLTLGGGLWVASVNGSVSSQVCPRLAAAVQPEVELLCGALRPQQHWVVGVAVCSPCVLPLVLVVVAPRQLLQRLPMLAAPHAIGMGSRGGAPAAAASGGGGCSRGCARGSMPAACLWQVPAGQRRHMTMRRRHVTPAAAAAAAAWCLLAALQLLTHPSASRGRPIREFYFWLARVAWSLQSTRRRGHAQGGATKKRGHEQESQPLREEAIIALLVATASGDSIMHSPARLTVCPPVCPPCPAARRPHARMQHLLAHKACTHIICA